MQSYTKGTYLGVNKEQKNIGDICLSETSYKKDLASDWHCHENPFFTLIMNGGSIEKRKSESIECIPGHVIFYNRDDPHKNINYQEGSKNFNLEFDGKWFDKFDIDLNNIGGTFLIKNPDLTLLIFRILKEYTLADACSSLSIQSTTLQLLTGIGGKNESKKFPKWLLTLKELLNDEASENFSLEHLSSILNVHPVTISRYFPKYFNCTLGEYVRKIRVSRSITSVRSNKKSLAAIAYENGFFDQSHFIKAFKEYTGFLPNKFRNL